MSLSIKSLITHFPGYLLFINPDYVVEYCNQHFAGLLNSSVDLVLKEPLKHFALFESFESKINKNNHSKITIHLDEYILTFDVQPVANETTQELEGFLCHADKKMKHHEPNILSVIANNDYFREIINHFPENIFIIDEDQRLVLCNENQAKLFGVDSAEQLIGLNMFEMGERVGLNQEAVEAIVAHNNQVMSSKKTSQYDEVGVIGGKEIYTKVWKKPIVDKETNKVVGIVGISCDMTSQGLTRFDISQIFEMLPASTFWVDENNEVVVCNTAQAKMMGESSPDNFIGRTLTELGKDFKWPDALVEQAVENNKQIMRANRKEVFEESYIGEDGKEQYFLVYKNPVISKMGKVSGVMGFSLDITKQKELEKKLEQEKEKADQANLAKTTFLMNVSHDLRTPCSNILGYSRCLLESASDSEQVGLLHSLSVSAETLMIMVGDVMTTCKQMDVIEVKTDWFDVAALFNSIISQKSNEAEQKGLKLLCSIPRLPEIKSDESLCKRMFYNTLSNAIQFTAEGRVEVQCYVDEHDDGAYLVVKISDTGIGIPRDMQDKIFDRFSKVSASFQDASEHHLGIGLYLVKQAAETLKARIHVESEVGKGTRFGFRIPVELMDERKTIDVTEESMPVDISYLKGRRCLLVEDGVIAGMLAKKVLEKHGAKVVWTKTVEESLNAFNEEFDFVLTDIGLPDGDGLALAESLVAICREKDDKLVPIFALTAHYQSDQYLGSVVDSIFLKPLSIDSLALISDVLKKQVGDD